MSFNPQNVIVLGAGSSGIAAARLAASRGATVTVVDTGPAARFTDVMARLPGVEGVFGEAALACHERAVDVVILSPGIDGRVPLVRQFSDRQLPIIGEIEYAYRYWNGSVIGLTGTNGKTTTTELTAHLLNACGISAVPAGNYGKPFAEVVMENAVGTVVLELSSFQLESIEHFKPDISMWLNFAPDHMDRYDEVDDYLNAKRNLFRNQNESDWAIINAENGPNMPLKARTITFTAYGSDADYTYKDGAIVFEGEVVARLNETHLSGKHNAENLMAALALGRVRGLPFEDLRKAASTYRAPRHRCERVGVWNGVPFINDSKATNLHALESCLRALEGPIVLIAGGKEKGLNYAPLKAYFGTKVSRLIAIGEIRDSLCQLGNGLLPCASAGSLDEAVQLAFEQAQQGDTVLFSPGTSSFDMFTGYEQRGDAFTSLVKHHLNTP